MKRSEYNSQFRSVDKTRGNSQAGPPLWETATASENAGNNPEWDMSAQPVPESEFDQRIVWCEVIFYSPCVGLCAGFSVRRFLALMRPILAVCMGEASVGFEDENRIG